MAFSFDLEQEEAYLKLDLKGSLMEKYEAKDLLTEVDESIASSVSDVILNLEDLTYLSSSGMGVLLSILTRSRSAGGEVVLLHVNEKLRKLLTITRLDNVFSTAANLEQATHLLLESKTKIKPENGN